MEFPRMFEFNDKWASFPGAYFANVPRKPFTHAVGASYEDLKARLTGKDRERLIEMYAARRPYSAEEEAKATRPLIRWGDSNATPIRREGETREEWLQKCLAR